MALFGSAYPVGKLGMGQFPPFAFAALRSAILTLALLPLWRLQRPPSGQWAPLLGFAVSMGVAVYGAMYNALALAEAVSPIVIGMQLSAPFAVVLGALILREPVRPLAWAAIAAAFAGVVLIAFEPALLGDLAALGLALVSALAYAVATLCARALRDLSPFALNGWMALLALGPLIALSALLESGQWAAIASAAPGDWAVLLHAALLVSLVGHVAMFSLYRHYPVAAVIPYYALMPVFGVALTLAVFAEVPPLQTLVGAAVVITATSLIHRTTVPSPSAHAAADPEPVELGPPADGALAPEDADALPR